MTDSPTPWPAGCAVLIPVFNHVRTVGDVVAGIRSAGAVHILVIDDGSTDGSGAAAQAAGCDALVTITPNRGKGHALREGLQRLASAGFTQVLTIDADMQHPPAEGARLAHASAAAPQALWLGVRDMAGAPFASRAGRWWTSLWTWVCCGCWPEDNQTGLRVYPLPAMTRLPVCAGRYAYEVESLIRAVWGGVDVARLPVAVRYPADRVTHFHKVKDNLRTAWAFSRLVARSLIPLPHARADGASAWGKFLGHGLAPRPCATAAALGAALGVAPIPGAQMLLCAWLAIRLRLNPAVALIASNISFGPLLAGWFALEALIGHAMLGGPLESFTTRLHAVEAKIDAEGCMAAVLPILGDMLVGALPVMLAAALVTGLTAGVISAVLWRRNA